MKGRLIRDKIFLFLIIFVSFLATIPLFLIFFYIFKKGVTAINLDFFIRLPRPVGESGGGVANAIVGTFMLIVIASLLAIPFALIVGIFLAEYKNSKIADLVRLFIDILQGVPSIVLGIVAYLWIVKSLNNFSAFSGGVALAIMMLPVIVKSTEETLKMIPHDLKEAALALGVPYYKVILKVILPCGLTGILTGILLSIARIAGETAPLLFTAFGSPYMNLNIFKPVNALPLVIFNYAMSPYPEWHRLAWGASLVLILLVLLLNLMAKIMIKRWKPKF